MLAEGDADTLSLDEIVRSKIVDAVRRVHLSAPAYLLESGHNFADEVYWQDRESGWVLLPDDFMRLIVFSMSDWERSVYTAISTTDPAYRFQRQRVKALRGTAQRPVCAVARRPEGLVLEFYSCKSRQATVSQAVYQPYPSVDAEGGIDISERCHASVIYTTAALTLATMGESQLSSEMLELAKTMIQ